MSRRNLKWRDKLGYNSATKGMSDGRAKGYHTSQCGGDHAKLESTRPQTAHGQHSGKLCTRPMLKLIPE